MRFFTAPSKSKDSSIRQQLHWIINLE